MTKSVGRNNCDKDWRKQIHFLSDVFSAVASLNLKVPNSRPSVNRLPRKIAPLRHKYLKLSPPPNKRPHPSRRLLFLLSPPCQVKEESDAAHPISGDSSSDAEDIDIEN